MVKKFEITWSLGLKRKTLQSFTFILVPIPRTKSSQIENIQETCLNLISNYDTYLVDWRSKVQCKTYRLLHLKGLHRDVTILEEEISF